MSTARRALGALLGALALAAPARADDPPKEPAADDKPEVTGDVRVGWRFIGGEGEGRYPQDFGLKDGPRVFDLNLYGRDPRPSAIFDEAEVHLSGIGDPESDYLATLRRSGVLELSGGYRRDDENYRATGDPFPYDTTRERSFFHGVWTPNRDLTIRFAWDRNDRTGDAFTQGNSFITGEAVPQRRTISQETDRFTLGADWAVDIWRFGITEIVSTSHVDDSRVYDAKGSDPSFDRTKIDVRSKAYTTSARAGVVLPGAGFDATLFLTHTDAPLEETPSGHVTDDSGTTQEYGGSGKLRRDATDWRLESSWRPHRDWELAVAGEDENLVDDQSGRFLVGGFTQSSPYARITDRSRRYAADLTWDATEQWRLRLGEEYLHEELFVPTDSHFNVPNDYKRNRPTDIDSTSWRTNVGADWKPTRKLSFGALARISTNDAPQTTTVPDQGDDYSLRARWDSAAGERVAAEDRWNLTTLLRRRSVSNSSLVKYYEMDHTPNAAAGEHAGEATNLGSATRATSLSQSAGWARDRWSVRGTATYRRFESTTDTAWGSNGTTAGGSSLFRLTTVGFENRDVTATLDVRYEVIRDRMRVFGTATRTNTSGDYTARWFDFTLGAEYDLVMRKDPHGGPDSPLVTLGLSVSSWRLDDKAAPSDDYATHAVEASMTYHF